MSLGPRMHKSRNEFCRHFYYLFIFLFATLHTVSAKHGERNGKKKRIKKRLDRPEDSDVFNKHSVPQESNNKHIDKENK